MRGNTGKTQQPARLTLASPVKLPHILPEKPCHSSTWNQDTWLAWKHVNNIYGSAFLLSDSKPWALQPSTFLHFSHLSFEPAGQWTEDIPAVLTAPRSGCQGLGCRRFPCLVLSLSRLSNIGQSLILAKTSLPQGISLYISSFTG